MNNDDYYIKKYRWRPLKKWLDLLQIRKGAIDMNRFIGYLKERIDYWNKARCEDCVTYHNSRNDAERLISGTRFKSTLELTNINNIVGFSSFASMDMYTMYAHLIQAKSNIEKNFFARLVCMNIYELTEDMTQLLGKDVDKESGRGYGIRPIVDDMEDKELTEELNTLCSKWNLFRKEIDKGNKNFCGIRNMTVAHKDHDFMKQYESINAIKWGQTIEDYEKFFGIFHDTNLFLVRVMKVFNAKCKKDIAKAKEMVKEVLNT